ncbi:hypothetical protein GXM_01784 [Nostoc sphaeroides CCNUC1]|uniref:Uncharacterized protein n=1 Tax=Nostoc sphaeroides CCNUC1 TaxID=2653204 RepID=A0A5P8VVE2_9NOSO|nr:hypothetical protein GXM_01784 [Nostoc sphaeroides CCNUC1]
MPLRLKILTYHLAIAYRYIGANGSGKSSLVKAILGINSMRLLAN